MPVCHRVYGLTLASDLPIPGFSTCNYPNEKADVQIRLKQLPPHLSIPPDSFADLVYSSSVTNAKGVELIRVWRLNENYYGFLYCDGAAFAVERNGREVWADWPEGYCLEDAATYIAGPVLGFVLRLRGILPLHASAIGLGNHAIAVMGSAGAGKSTTAAMFARMGCAILSEDISVLDERSESIRVQPGYPRINMWPDSVELLFGRADALPLVTPTWGKRFLDLGQSGYRFQSQSLPLTAVYYLEVRQEGLRAPVIEKRKNSATLVSVVANTYVNYLLDARMREREFASLRRLLSEVSVRFVTLSEDPARIHELCDALHADAEKLKRTSSAELSWSRSQNV